MTDDKNVKKTIGNQRLFLTKKTNPQLDDIPSRCEKDIYNSHLKYRMISAYRLFDKIR
jgi:hypothetical protein